MKLYQPFSFAPLLVCLIGYAYALVGYGDGTSGGSHRTSVSSNAVSSPTSKEPITGATCTLYSAANAVLATGIATAGAVNFGTLTATGPVYTHCTGGTVRNTASMTSVGVLVAGQPLSISMTPLTTIAWNAVTDGADNYGAMLAAIAKIKNNNDDRSLTAVMTTLGHAVNTNGAMTSAISALLATAASNLTHSDNSNLSVQVYAASSKSTTANKGKATSKNSSTHTGSIVMR